MTSPVRNQPPPPARRADPATDGPPRQRPTEAPPPPHYHVHRRDEFQTQHAPTGLRRVQQEITALLTSTRTHPTLTPGQVSQVHDKLGRLDPADYRRALDGMSRNGQLSRYLQAMTPHQRSAFVQQAASKGYLRMEGGRPCEGTANPPRVPALYNNDASVPPEVREAVTATNQQVAQTYAQDVNAYSQRYADQASQVSSVPELRDLGAPVEPAPMTEPGTGATLAQPSIAEALEAILKKIVELLSQVQALMQQQQGATPAAQPSPPTVSATPEQPPPPAVSATSEQPPPPAVSATPDEQPPPPAQAATSSQNPLVGFACAFVGMTADQLQNGFDPQAFFRMPLELMTGANWNQLGQNRQSELNQNGWTPQEWSDARSA